MTPRRFKRSTHNGVGRGAHNGVRNMGGLTLPSTGLAALFVQRDGQWVDIIGLSGKQVTKYQNRITYSEDFTNAAWLKDSQGTALPIIVEPNTVVAPDTTQTACRLVLNLNGGTTLSDYTMFRQVAFTQPSGSTSSEIWIKSNTSACTLLCYAGDRSEKLLNIATSWQKFRVLCPETTYWQLALLLRGALGTSDVADISIWHPQNINCTGLDRGSSFFDYSKNLAGVQNVSFSDHIEYSIYDDMVCLGDSFTNAGVYITTVQNLLYYAVLTNKGVGGDTVAMMLARFNADVVALGAKSVLIAGCVNDFCTQLPTSDPNASVRASVSSMVALARSNEIIPILTTCPPFGGHTGWNADRQAWMESYNTWVTGYAIAEGLQIVDIYNTLRTPEDTTLLAAYDSGDHLHPNNTGYAAYGHAVAAIMDEPEERYTYVSYSLLDPPQWPSTHALISVIGADNVVFDADGVGKVFDTPALALSALDTLADDTYLFAGTKAAALYSVDMSAQAAKIKKIVGD